MPSEDVSGLSSALNICAYDFFIELMFQGHMCRGLYLHPVWIALAQRSFSSPIRLLAFDVLSSWCVVARMPCCNAQHIKHHVSARFYTLWASVFLKFTRLSCPVVLKVREEQNLFEISALSQRKLFLFSPGDVSCANTDVWRSCRDFKGVLENF